MTWLGLDTPTIDAIAAVAPLAVAHLIAIGALVWLTDRTLRLLDRELERRHAENDCTNPDSGDSATVTEQHIHGSETSAENPPDTDNATL